MYAISAPEASGDVVATSIAIDMCLAFLARLDCGPSAKRRIIECLAPTPNERWFIYENVYKQ